MFEKLISRIKVAKQNTGFRLRLFITITLILWLMFVGGIAIWSAFTDQLIKKQLGEMALAVVKTSALSVENMEHWRLRNRADEKTAIYKNISSYLQEVRQSNPRIRYLYTARITPDKKMFFVVDLDEPATSTRTYSAAALPGKSHIGDLYNEPPEKYPECISAMLEGKPSLGLDYARDQWGIWITAAAPLRTPDGKTEAILAADISIEEIILNQKKNKRTILYLSFLTAILLGLLASWFIAVRLTRPILEMELAARRISEGNFSRELKLKGPAELGELVKSFNQMRLKIYNDRERIARDLHDGVIQIIRAAIYSVEYLAKNPPSFNDEIPKLKNTLDKAISEIRSVILSLSPAKVIEKGLIPAMRYYALKVREASGIEYVFYTNLPDNFSMPEEEEAVKIYLEALNNVKYNSGASRMEIYFEKNSSGDIILKVADNGRGFNLEEKLSKNIADGKFGLKNMFDRAKQHNWELSITSLPGKGTTVLLRIPR